MTAGAHFDHENDGFAEQTGWVGQDDGLLVRDLNGNAKIDIGAELFGSETRLANGQKAANGFEALRELDTNLDGKVDASDAAFSSLRIWKDANGDGQTDAGELISLADAGVQSINVAYVNNPKSIVYSNGDLPDYFSVDAHGNDHRQTGSYTTVAGLTRTADDVWFDVDRTYSLATETLEIPADVAALPNASGYGKVRDLHQAMVRDTSGVLKTLVTQFTQATTTADREARLQSVIYQWAGVANVDPESRAASQIYGNAIGDARKLEALEEFMGEEWLGIWCWGTFDPNPHGSAAPVLLEAYADLFERIYSELASGSFLKPLFDEIRFSSDESGTNVQGDLTSVAAILTDAINTNRAAGKELLTEFVRALKGLEIREMIDLNAFAISMAPCDSDVLEIIDSLFVTSGTYGADTLIGANLHGLYGDDTLYGLSGDDLLDGGGGNDVLYGRAGDDLLDGGDANDVLYGDAGADLLAGGHGNDQLYGGSGVDKYQFNRGDGQDTVHEDYLEDTWLDIGNLSLTELVFQHVGSDLKVGFQSSSADTIALADFFKGAEPQTNLVLKNSNGETQVFETNELIRLTLVSAQASGVLIGSSRNDTIFGSDWGNFIDGGLGADTMVGGASNDTYVVDNVGDVIVEAVGGGTDTLRASASVMMASNVENAILTGIANINVTGNASNNVIYGNTGANVLLGMAGDDELHSFGGGDTLDGGEGKDTIIQDGSGYATVLFGRGDGQDCLYWKYGKGGSTTLQFKEGVSAADLVVFRRYNGGLSSLVIGVAGLQDFIEIYPYPFPDCPLAGADPVPTIKFSNGSTWLPSYESIGVYGQGPKLIETDIDGSDNNDWLLGSSANEWLRSGAGNDRLDGGAGDDFLFGGNGSNTYVFGRGYGRDTEITGKGRNDTYADLQTKPGDIQTVFLKGLNPSDVELRRLVNTSSYDMGLDDLEISIIGTTDSLTIRVFTWTTSIGEVKFNLNQIEFQDGTIWNQTDILNHLTVQDAVVITEDAWWMPLFGGSGNDTLIGGNFDEIFDGGVGNDRMVGGAGNDRYFVRDAGDVIVELANEGVDQVSSLISWALADNLENLVLAHAWDGPADINGTGNGLNNVITGNDGNNILNGAGGVDTLIGGWGDDTYYVDVSGDKPTETDEWGGVDTVMSTISWTLGANLENLTLIGSAAINGTGNALDNVITGNSGANVLKGGAGDDTYIVGAGDTTTELAGGGIDTVQSSITWTLASEVENLTLTGTNAINGTGNALANVLTGNSAANTLSGLGGDDQYRYNIGGGADRIVETTGNDRIVFGAGITAGQLVVSRSAGVVKLAVSASDSISFDELGGGAFAVEQFEFADSGVLGASWLNSILPQAAPSATNLSAAETYTEDTARNLVDIVVSDSDNTSTTVVLTLSTPLAGSLNTGTSGAVASTYNAASGVWSASGAIANVNTLLAALTFTPKANFNGSFSINTSVSDGIAAPVTGSKSITGVAVNDAASGNVTITGTASQNQTLTASNTLADVDGMGTISYQWKAGGVAIAGATSSTLVLGSAQVGKTISVTASFTDGGGTLESATSAATATVAGSYVGTAGADTLSGTNGADNLAGLAGNDTYVVNNAGDIVVENLNEGTDLVQASVNYTLTANVENLTLTGTGALNGTGNALANLDISRYPAISPSRHWFLHRASLAGVNFWM